MKNKKYRRHPMLILCIALLIANLLVWREYNLQADGKVHVHFFDVGQGDATLIVTPSGSQILIDGGPNTSTLEHLGTVLPFFDRSIELLVLTHPDTDHLVALPEVLRRYSVKNVLLAGTEKRLGRYQAILDVVTERNIPVLFSQPGKQMDFGDGVTAKILWPNVHDVGNIPKPNDASVTMIIDYKAERILLPGDIEEEAERGILASGVNLQASILKAPHHGSRTSSSTGFLLAVSPKLVIVSSGANNPFGHPHPSISDRYESLGFAVRNTALEGTISLEF